MCLKISLVSSILKAQVLNIFSDCKFIACSQLPKFSAEKCNRPWYKHSKKRGRFIQINWDFIGLEIWGLKHS